MHRLGPVLMLAIALGAASAPAGAKQRSPCQRLQGKDLAPARTVKLVRRRNGDDGTDLRGCVLPRGRVRTIASSADFYTTTYDYDIRQVAGRVVLLYSRYSSQYAYSDSTHVADVASGRSYTVASQCSEIGGSPCGRDATIAPAVFITKLGRAVAAILPAPIGPAAPSPVTIAAFDPSGRRRDLDSGPPSDLPPSSLTLAGTIASWAHAGQPRSADISAPG